MVSSVGGQWFNTVVDYLLSCFCDYVETEESLKRDNRFNSFAESHDMEMDEVRVRSRVRVSCRNRCLTIWV